MKTTELKREIENLAKEMNVSFVEACKAMQSAAAQMGNEEIIGEVHKLKMASIGL